MTTEFDMPQTESDHYDITISIYRDPKSYDVSRDRSNPSNMALDTLIIKNNKTGEMEKIYNVQSVANYPETGGGENNHPDYMDDTVVGYFDFIPGATTTVATGPAAIIANAKTRGGYTIGSDGISSSNLSPGKHYVHSTGNPEGGYYLTKNSKGCIILSVEGAELLFNTLEAWGANNSNANIRGVIIEKKY